MKIKVKHLFIAWALIVALLLWAFIDSVSAYTKPVIRYSDLSWSSYHSYHCIKQWCDDTDEMIIYMSKMRSTLRLGQTNKQWAKKKVKKWMKYPVKKRVHKIFDYITENYEYDSDVVWLEDARRVGRANCSAFADLFYVLCKASKIPVTYVIGWANNGRTAWWHCWNRVKVQKKWYWIDCTWGNWLSRKLWRTHSRIIEEW